ncbi:hypothetical protein [Aliikangiella sp. G2MR2-5]|uniref:hypothetical protein n=1 Tax=Aliikangiella sp. G2MR2-5 TaxID=2788943 RepID=UPI0018AA75C2|nr:hypothetical protein [Aliikangiella sp. G2MR2-5]
MLTKLRSTQDTLRNELISTQEPLSLRSRVFAQQSQKSPSVLNTLSFNLSLQLFVSYLKAPLFSYYFYHSYRRQFAYFF